MLHILLARTDIPFKIDTSFSLTEFKIIAQAQTYWNRYTSSPCKLTYIPARTPLDQRSLHPTNDNVYSIRGQLSDPDAQTYTIKRSIRHDDVRVILDIDININLLYTRRCPNVLLPFLIHEFGHALGLPHNDYPNSIMNLTSNAPLCDTKFYPPFLSGIDVYLLYHVLGGSCIVNTKSV